MTQPYAIEMRGITKTFGSVVANNNINLSVRPGEILALLGENGSGKTTLMNMLSGIYKPDKAAFSLTARKSPFPPPRIPSASASAWSTSTSSWSMFSPLPTTFGWARKKQASA